MMLSSKRMNQRHARVVSKTRLRHEGGHPRHRAESKQSLAWITAFAAMTWKVPA
jgi:hypothetical protein